MKIVSGQTRAAKPKFWFNTYELWDVANMIVYQTIFNCLAVVSVMDNR